MPNPFQRPGAAPPARAPAPHVQAAVSRTAQARMAAPLPSHRPAAHVLAAVRGTAQAKPAPAPAARPSHVQAAVQRIAQAKPAQVRTSHLQAAVQQVAQAKPGPAAPRPSARPAAPPWQRTLQMMEIVELPKNITGMDRDGETVRTAGGTWKAVRYVAVKRLEHAPAWGASMTLEFTPEYPADATKIALVQTVTACKNLELYYPDPTTRKRALGGTTAIDHYPESRSPLYADALGTGSGTLGSSTVEPQSGQHGRSCWDPHLKRWVVEPARLRDTPHLRGVAFFSSQTFETTALAVAGFDKGTYYGSVSWGWRLKNDGDVLLDPLSVVSQGSASETFQHSAEQWNQTKTSEGETPQQLPAVRGRPVIEVPVNRTRDNPTFTAITDDKL